jgi:hypothetical protein
MNKVIIGTTKWKPIRRAVGPCWMLDFQIRVKRSLIVQTDGSMKCFKRGFKKNVEALGLVAWNQETCSRCFGEKIFRHWGHVQGGKCFKCGGVGTTAKMLVADEISKNKPQEETHPLFGK